MDTPLKTVIGVGFEKLEDGL